MRKHTAIALASSCWAESSSPGKKTHVFPSGVLQCLARKREKPKRIKHPTPETSNRIQDARGVRHHTMKTWPRRTRHGDRPHNTTRGKNRFQRIKVMLEVAQNRAGQTPSCTKSLKHVAQDFVTVCYVCFRTASALPCLAQTMCSCLSNFTFAGLSFFAKERKERNCPATSRSHGLMVSCARCSAWPLEPLPSVLRRLSTATGHRKCLISRICSSL